MDAFQFIFIFSTNITIFTTNKCEKCPFSIWCWDSNTHPSEHVSPPITTRPGLPPCDSFASAMEYSTTSITNGVHFQFRFLIKFIKTGLAFLLLSSNWKVIKSTFKPPKIFCRLERAEERERETVIIIMIMCQPNNYLLHYSYITCVAQRRAVVGQPNAT